MDLDIYSLYNLNIINLNKLIKEKISIELDNFLYNNNLTEIPKNSRDYKKIYNHFIIINLIFVLKEDYNNILLYDEKMDYSNFSPFIKSIAKLLKLNLFNITFNNNIELDIPLNMDINLIYEFKAMAESKKKINLKKIEDFCKKNDLTQLSANIKNNVKTKLILHK